MNLWPRHPISYKCLQTSVLPEPHPSLSRPCGFAWIVLIVQWYFKAQGYLPQGLFV